MTVLGPSGSGKSSLLNFISGTIDSDFTVEGEVWLDGIALHTLPAYKRQVGLQLQQHLLFPHMTVIENLLFALPARYSKVERFNRAKQALKYVIWSILLKQIRQCYQEVKLLELA